MNKLILKQEVLDAYDGYVKAFVKGDAKEVENYLSFPNYRFLDGDIEAASLPTGSGASYKPYFCKNCGTYIYCKYDMAPGRIVIRTSTLNDSENFPPQAHIFTRSKVPWITLDDKIPSFESMYDRNKLWPKSSLEKLNSIF